MEGTYQPSRQPQSGGGRGGAGRGALLFFFFSIFVALAILAWVFIINIGYVEVEGAPPFRVTVGSEEKTCEALPCIMRVKPRSYVVRVSKEGYRTLEKKVQVSWRSVSKMRADLVFIPVVREVGELVIPFENAPLSAPFLGKASLPKFPKNIKSALFSPSGNAVLLEIGKEMYLYDVQTAIVSKTAISADVKRAWLGESIIFLSLEKGAHVLKRLDKGKISSIVTFARPFEKPTLSGSPNGVNALIEDGGSFYFVNAEKKSRTRLPLKETTQFSHFLSNYIIFKEEGAERNRIYAMDLETLGLHEILTLDSLNVREVSNGKLLAVTGERLDAPRTAGRGSNGLAEARLGLLDEDREASGVTISEAIESATRETIASVSRTSRVFISEVDFKDAPPRRGSNGLAELQLGPEEDSYTTIAEVELAGGEHISRLTPDMESGKIYFEKNKRLFEIVLRPAPA